MVLLVFQHFAEKNLWWLHRNVWNKREKEWSWQPRNFSVSSLFQEFFHLNRHLHGFFWLSKKIRQQEKSVNMAKKKALKFLVKIPSLNVICWKLTKIKTAWWGTGSHPPPPILVNVSKISWLCGTISSPLNLTSFLILRCYFQQYQWTLNLCKLVLNKTWKEKPGRVY